MHGNMSLDQLWSARPVLGYGSYRGPLKGLYMCGAGAHPGGDGVVRRLRFLAPLQVTLLSTRRDHRPAGIAGGGEALAGRQRLIQVGGESMELSGCFSITVSAGDAIEIETPGGGGYGAAPAGAGSTPTTGTRS